MYKNVWGWLIETRLERASLEYCAVHSHHSIRNVLRRQLVALYWTQGIVSLGFVTVRGEGKMERAGGSKTPYALSLPLAPTSAGWPQNCVFVAVNEARRYLATRIRALVRLYNGVTCGSFRKYSMWHSPSVQTSDSVFGSRGLSTSGDSSNLAREIILLHDNTRCYVANTIKTKVQHMRREVLEHPAYIPDLLLCDVLVVGPLKQGTQGMPILVGRSSETSCSRLFTAASFRNSSRRASIQRLVTQWGPCLNADGDFEWTQ
jgi:hypothetical protein